MKIGFVLPCYNEFENIFILIKQIKKIFKDHLIVIVDDSSTSEIKNRIIKYKKIKYFKRKAKSGRGSAVLFGMNKILEDSKVDLIVEMDTDLSSHPKELPENIKYFKKEKLDLLVMSRYLKGSKIINWPIRRRLFSFLSNKLANFLLKGNVSDYTMGLRIVSRPAIEHVVKNCGKVGDGFIVLSEILAELNLNNFKIKDTKTVFINREKGASTVNIKLIYESLIGIFKIYLQKSRNFVLGDFRSKRLSNLIVKKIIKYNKKKFIKILDYGAGYQPKVVYFIFEQLTKIHKKKILIDCYDFYSTKEIKKLNNINNKSINFFNIGSIGRNKKKYDFCFINDVIHHIGIEKEKLIIKILNNLINVSEIVIIKDHFQQGFFSNNVIRFMDFLGNYFNNVNTPNKYYSKESFQSLLNKLKVTTLEKISSIKLYPSFLLFMSNPNFNFLYLINKDKKI
ncbi:MAG: glycosyltransferase [Pelagibacterales bacterium]|nr:glycosyltransferase [Pelagibacterales bacterium]